MALEISGKLIKKLPEVTGTGKNGTNWIKQEFVIETQDLTPVQEGEIVKVQFNVESREYNERWYTEIRAYRLDRTGSIPAGVEPTPAAGGYQFPPLAAESGDDLPF